MIKEGQKAVWRIGAEIGKYRKHDGISFSEY